MKKKFLSTREVAERLNVNEKMVYSLVAEKGLPATKITGKWLFPEHLVEQWIENSTLNYPSMAGLASQPTGLLIICGSNDPLLERTISLFNTRQDDYIVVFGNLGSMGGIKALRRNLCHIAASHLLEEKHGGYNFEFVFRELDKAPALVNFCNREQGLLVAKGNPKQIASVADLARPDITIVNRPLGTGTRLLFDRELKKEGIDPEKLNGYFNDLSRHLDVGLEIFSGRADAGPGIRAAAALLDIGFVPLRWERFDLMILKERFFDEATQRFLGLLHDEAFKKLASWFSGYDLNLTGKMIYPEKKETPEAPET